MINAGLDPFSYPVELIGYITQAPACSFPGGIIYLPLDARDTDHEQLALAAHEIHHQQTYQSGNPGQVFEQLIREAYLATQGIDVYNTQDHPQWYLENEAQRIETSALIILRKPL